MIHLCRLCINARGEAHCFPPHLCHSSNVAPACLFNFQPKIVFHRVANTAIHG